MSMAKCYHAPHHLGSSCWQADTLPILSWISENVDEGPNASAIHQGFMKSPQHRANILDTDINSAGIGVAERNGLLYAVEDFSKAK
jgi:uncharacterized protein YkwD